MFESEAFKTWLQVYEINVLLNVNVLALFTVDCKML